MSTRACVNLFACHSEHTVVIDATDEEYDALQRLAVLIEEHRTGGCDPGMKVWHATPPDETDWVERQQEMEDYK